MSLRQNDLKYFVDKIFEIDSFSSKMGNDDDIVTVSFSVKEKQPADDLVNFLEKGYSFILDADVSPGELEDSNFKVFVEIERDRDIGKNIYEMIQGVTKLSGVDNWKYRYYKNFQSKTATLENFEIDIPKDANSYALNKDQVTMENYKNFFKNSYLESVEMIDDTIILHKPFSEKLHLKFNAIGKTDKILANINESYNPWEFAEIIYLTKYIGDYNITKYGQKLTFENAGHTLVAERMC
tara:strand:- start:121 stop:837 length:717 start_codon:yes stop_codon:yes gene_type:complete